MIFFWFCVGVGCSFEIQILFKIDLKIMGKMPRNYGLYKHWSQYFLPIVFKIIPESDPRFSSKHKILIKELINK